MVEGRILKVEGSIPIHWFSTKFVCMFVCNEHWEFLKVLARL